MYCAWTHKSKTYGHSCCDSIKCVLLLRGVPIRKSYKHIFSLSTDARNKSFRASCQTDGGDGSTEIVLLPTLLLPAYFPAVRAAVVGIAGRFPMARSIAGHSDLYSRLFLSFRTHSDRKRPGRSAEYLERHDGAFVNPRLHLHEYGAFAFTAENDI